MPQTGVRFVRIRPLPQITAHSGCGDERALIGPGTWARLRACLRSHPPRALRTLEPNHQANRP
eukprot:666019-Alexandrium_andersonii.AAC.1